MAQSHAQENQGANGAFSSLVSGPVAPLLTTAEAKEHLRVDLNDENDLIDAYVSAATDMVDAQWGELGRALITQTWRLTLPIFPASGTIILPIPPVQRVTGITYYDADNAQQILAANTYRLTVKDEYAVIDKVSGASWPSTFSRPDAVELQYDTGYGDNATDVPEGIRHAVRLLVSHWFGARSAATEGSFKELPLGVRSLLQKYRISRGLI